MDVHVQSKAEIGPGTARRAQVVPALGDDDAWQCRGRGRVARGQVVCTAGGSPVVEGNGQASVIHAGECTIRSTAVQRPHQQLDFRAQRIAASAG